MGLPPKIESIYYQRIAGIEADEESNGVAGTLIGEKIKIEASDGEISARTVGKGSAQKLRQEILSHKENCKMIDIPGPKSVGSMKIKKNSLRRGRVILALVFFFAGISGMRNKNFSCNDHRWELGKCRNFKSG